MEGAVALGLVGGLSLVFCGWLVRFAITSAAVAELGKNPSVGIRTRATQASEAAWVAGHRAAVPWTRRVSRYAVVVGALLAVAGLAAAAGAEPVRGPLSYALHALYALGYGGLLLGVVPITRAANRAARAAHAADRSAP